MLHLIGNRDIRITCEFMDQSQRDYDMKCDKDICVSVQIRVKKLDSNMALSVG